MAGTEQEALFGALNRLRATFHYKADGLDRLGLQSRMGASTLTLGGLLKHLAATDDYTTTVKLNGRPIGEPWISTGWDGAGGWKVTSAADARPASAAGPRKGAAARRPRRGQPRPAAPGRGAASTLARHDRDRRVLQRHSR